MSSALDRHSDLQKPSKSLVDEILALIQRGESTRQLLHWLPPVIVESFDLQGCQIELYDPQQQTIVLLGGMDTNGYLESVNQPQEISQFWEFYKPLTLGKSLQFSSKIFKTNTAIPLVWLGCPMLEATGLLGNLWLTRPDKKTFSKVEVNQLQQIANCVAISLHTSQLQQTLETQRTEIQQLKKAKDELLQLISHELFVPLGNIQLSTQTLERIFKDVSWRKVPQRSTVLKVLSLLSQECRRQKQFVDNLITLMFPEYQKVLEPVLMKVGDWLPSLLRSFEARFEQESITLKTNIPKDPLLLECDVAQLERIITELIANALKYTPPKKTVTVSVQALPSAVEIAIANTGVHIPPQHQAQIFEKFYRVPELDQRQYGGSGLGLALVKQLLRNLGGTIELKSTKQKTTFTVQLPK
ncbi:MAG: HAMP domain-containing sensor histidine kinase [Cyanobacteria bacterium P01_F01_bin.116]